MRNLPRRPSLLLTWILVVMLSLTLTLGTASSAYASEPNGGSMNCAEYESDKAAKDLCEWFEFELNVLEDHYDEELRGLRLERDAAIRNAQRKAGQIDELRDALASTEAAFLESERQRVLAVERSPSRLVWFGLGVGTTVVVLVVGLLVAK